MSANVGSGQPQLFKYLYPDEAWRMLVSANRPFLTMVPKGDSATGATPATGAIGPQTGIVHAWNFSNPQGVSQSYGVALANQDSLVSGTQFIVQLSQFYKFLRFNAKELRASQNKMAAYVSSKKMNFDAAIKQIGLEIDLACHRAGNGIIATVTAIGANTITLAATTSLQQWQKGMRLASASTFPLDGTLPVDGGGRALVLGVAQAYSATGYTLTVTVDNNNLFDATTNKYVSLQGNQTAFSAANTEGGMIGMGNWVPTTDPAGSDNFLGMVPRAQDIMRLSGVRILANGRTYREAIQEAAAVSVSLDGRPDVGLLNPIDWQKCNMEIQQGARYETFNVGTMAFKAMMINGPAGDIRLMSDPNQDVGTVRLLTLDTWKLWHMGELVHTAMEDGLELRKDPGSDAFQLEIRSWPQLVCFDPRANAVVSGF